MPANSQTPSSPASSALPAALLLAATGGLLDAIVYLDHGHVFANAMTGNVIFLGIAIITRDWPQVVRHLVPLCAFLAGVIAARILVSFPRRYGALLSISLEILAIFVVGALPATFPELAFTGTISFVSAFQVTTFRRIGRFTYNSTFITGNLREVATGAYDRIFADDPGHRFLGGRKAAKLAGVCAAFLCGALAGASISSHQVAHAVWFAEPMLLIVLILTLLRPETASH